MTRLDDALTRDIRFVAESLGIVLSRNKMKAYCPEHSRGPGKGSPSVSFYVRDGKWKFKCHGCQKSGDNVDLVGWVTERDMSESVEWLTGAKLNGVKVSYPEVKPEPEEVPTQMRIAACTSFVAALGEMEEFGLEWLEKERGIKRATAVDFRLTDISPGKADTALGAAIQATDVDTCLRLGLAKRSAHSDKLYCPMGFAYFIAIPYLTDRGSVAHVQFRRVHRGDEKGDGPKYMHIRGAVPIPFNLPGTRAPTIGDDGKGRCFLVEGALDALSLSQIGLTALGIPGVGWLNKDRSESLVGRLTEHTRPVVAFDADEAGKKASEAIVDVLADLGAEPLAVGWPEDFSGDWCDWFLTRRGGEAPDVLEPRVQLLETEAWIGDLMREGAQEIVDIASGEKVSNQVMTGYSMLDKMLELQPGDMVVVAARPSVGKSHFVLSLLQRMAKKFSTTSLFVSLEMSRPSITKRIAKAEMRLGQDVQKSGSLLSVSAHAATRSFEDMPVLVDFGRPDLDRVLASCYSGVKKHGAGVLVIDYLQLLRTKGRTREQEVAACSRAIKAMSNELLVPVITVVQMNREIEHRANRRPQMSDLRDSGQIEQDADVILFVDRPFAHDINTSPTDFNVIIAKQRNGTTGSLTMHLPEPFGWLEDREFRYAEQQAG